MSKIIIFNNQQFGEIRTLKIEGKPYFVGKDIAEKLGYSNTSKALSDHCKNSIMIWGNDSLGRKQEMKAIPEGDLYRLIIKSQLPKAQDFESWVMDEVLPQIRQTGGYIPISENESDEDFLARALIVATNTLKKKDELIAQKDKQLSEQAPIVDYANTVLDPTKVHNKIDMTTLAKDAGLSTANQLNEILHQNGIQYKQGRKPSTKTGKMIGGKWTLYKEYQWLADEKYVDFETRIVGFGSEETVVTNMSWTELGRKWILENLEDFYR